MFKSCHSDQPIKHLANPEKCAPKKLPKKLSSVLVSIVRASATEGEAPKFECPS